MAITMKWAMARIDEFAGLEANWDSYGSAPITPDAMREAKNLLTEISVPMWPVPCNGGGIQLELDKSGDHVEIEIGPEGNIQGVLFERNGTFLEYDTYPVDELKKSVQEMYNRAT